MTHRFQPRSLRLRLAAAATVLALLALAEDAVAGTASADVELWRLDCGEVADIPLDLMSDVFAYPGQKITLTNSCFLIRHNHEYMLWDTGLRPDEPRARGRDASTCWFSRHLQLRQVTLATGASADLQGAYLHCKAEPRASRDLSAVLHVEAYAELGDPRAPVGERQSGDDGAERAAAVESGETAGDSNVG